MIRYKTIVHERTEDAPFIGALISAVDCHIECQYCFNQDLREMPVLKDSAENIINEVTSNPLNEGIIMGGMEWSEQLPEMFELVKLAASKGLKIMIYTGKPIEEYQSIIRHIQRLNLGVDIYVKTDPFITNSECHKMFEVTLASKNQQIVKI